MRTAFFTSMFAAVVGTSVPAIGLHAALAADASDRERLEELQRLAKEAGLDLNLDLPSWDVTAEFEFGAGYDSNVGLSAVAPDSSSLLRGNTSVIAWRMPEGGFDWLNYLDWTYAHYFAAGTDRAVLGIMGSEAHWTLSQKLEARLAGRYTYQNEVLDAASAFDSSAQFLQARLQSFQVEPSVRWSLARVWALTTTVRAERQDLIDSPNDLNQYELELGLEHPIGRAGTLALFAGRVARDYGERAQLNAFGNVILDSRLDVTQTWGQIRHVVKWGKLVKWRAHTRATWLDNGDNGDGWFDYRRTGLTCALSVEAGGWLVEFDGGVRRYAYRLQPAQVFTGNPPPRRRSDTEITVRVERDLSEGLVAFLECTGERSGSNDPYLKYDDFIAILGLRLSR